MVISNPFSAQIAHSYWTDAQDNLSIVMRKPAFCICENKDADQLRGTAKLISDFVFATRIVQSLFFLNPKFQASYHLLWLYSLVCVGPGRKPRRPIFSERGSFESSLGAEPKIVDFFTHGLICFKRIWYQTMTGSAIFSFGTEPTPFKWSILLTDVDTNVIFKRI